MEHLTELLQEISLKPIDSIVNRFQSNIKNGSDHEAAISTFLNDLVIHFNVVENTSTIETTKRYLSITNHKLMVKEVPVTAFEDLIASIKKPASNKKILTIVINIVIELNKEDISIPLALPQHYSVTRLKKIAEALGYDKTTATLTDALKSDTSGKIYRNVDGFWDFNFIKKKTWSGLVNRIWYSYRDNGQCGNENVFSSNMDEDALRSWLHAFRDRYLIQLMKEQDFIESNQPAVNRRRNDPLVRGKFCHTTKPSQLNGGKSERKLDFFIESSEIPDCEIHNWRDVRVVGEITSSEKQIGIKFNQLMRYVREIFYSQPLRRFVHGFCLHEDHIEFWIIDRAGAYSSGKYDVLEDQEMLVRGLSSYMLMSDEELGLNPVTSYDDADRCFVSSTNDKNETAKLEVNTTPIARPETIVSRGITCFRTIDENYLIKFSWGTGAKENEIKFLSCDKKIPRVTQMISSGNLYQVRTHRKGIKLSINQILEINGVEQSPFCGSRMTSHPEEYGINRGLTLTILSLSGRPLHSFSTVWEFVSGIRDVIIGLCNLHDRNIVHGDISAEKIILTGPDKTGVTKGTLIDIDMVSLGEDENEKNLPRAITGTRMFMALELLESIADNKLSLKQTYRHDLESCFYVLIVGCMTYGAESIPKILQHWYSDDADICYSVKSNMMNNFRDDVIDRFLPQFEGVEELACDLHKILFGNKYIGHGSPVDPNILYDPIIDAFNKNIMKLEAYVSDKKNNDNIW
ncbi:unnamed protein product [Blumeria hordei]|uniref:Fungal-type protein kinase domain-containing protein n=1 Tax=Blumeria hordei TaxID=2867405 RepID=A0A383V1F0_BLUHO|nr:unnamed protein product [Blumeria hordei]